MNLLVNPVEKRMRATWRLCFQFALFFFGSSAFALLLSAFAVLILALSGAIPSAAFDDPAALSALLSARVLAFPFLQAANGVSTLGVMLLTYWLAARYVDRRPLADFGFHFGRAWWRDLAFGLALGAGLMLLVFAVELAAGWIEVRGAFANLRPGLPFSLGLLQDAILFVCVGIYEEMLSRGYQLRNLAEGLNLEGIGPRRGLWLGYLLSSLIFGALHLANPHASLVSTLNLMLVGLFLGLGFVLTGELAIPIGLHIAWNFFQGDVFGFPVSGGAPGVALIEIRQNGPDLWTGGQFGPEAGLIGLLAIVVGGLLVLAWVRRTRGSLELQARLAEYRPPPDGVAQAGAQPMLPAG